MQPSPPSQPKTFRKSWAVSGRYIKILSWKSACRKRRSWLRMWTHLQTLQPWSMNWSFYMTSFTGTLARQSLMISGLRAKQTHRQGCHYHFQPDQESMVQQEADAKYQNPGLQSLCFEHAAVRQRVLDHTCSLCGKECHSRIGFFSHKRRCSRTTNESAT